MAISTQRLILIFLVTNMMIGMAMNMYFEPTTYSNDQIDVDEQAARITQNTQNTKESWFGSLVADVRRGYENTVGNTVAAGGSLLRLFWNGMYPFSFTPSDFDTEAEKQMARVIMWIRGLLTTLLLIETYMFLKNKKTS